MRKILVPALAVLLFAGGLAYIGKGLAMPWIRGEAIDLELRSGEYDYFASGIYPHRRVAEAVSGETVKKHTVYPPYAFVMFSVVLWPSSEHGERLLFQIFSLVALVRMAAYGAQTLRFAGAGAAFLGAALPLAFSGNYVAFYQGQFSIISVGLVIGQMLLLQKDHPGWAGVCWALAMIKPQVAIAFGLLFLLRRQYWRGLILGLGLLGTMTFLALWWTNAAPSIFWEKGVAAQGLRFVETTSYAAAVWVEAFGIPPRTATLTGLGVLSIAGFIFLAIGARKHVDIGSAAAVCSALGLSLFYHVHYDNMMLFPLMLALVAAALRQGSILLWTTAAALAAICYAEPAFVMGWVEANSAARWFVFFCPIAASALLFLTPKVCTDSTVSGAQ